jgi:antitoxin PrlF
MSQPFQSRMTSKGQVTVPAELRRELGLKPGDRVEFVRENGSIQVRKAESIVMKLAGSVPSRGVVLEPDDIHRIVEEGVAEEYARELQKQREEVS